MIVQSWIPSLIPSFIAFCHLLSFFLIIRILFSSSLWLGFWLLAGSCGFCGFWLWMVSGIQHGFVRKHSCVLQNPATVVSIYLPTYLPTHRPTYLPTLPYPTLPHPTPPYPTLPHPTPPHPTLPYPTPPYLPTVPTYLT